jgi:hypothetical protein
MNPDNPYQPTPRPEAQPPEPLNAAPVTPQYVAPASPQPPLEASPPVRPEYSPTGAPLPQPIPLGAAAVQNTPQYAPSNDPYSVDYLNQIAPVQTKSTNRFAIFALIGTVLLAVVAAVVIFVNAGPPDFSVQAKSIQSRITTLQGVTDGQQNHLKENAISEANSSLDSALTSMNTELTALMKAKGIKGTSAKTKTVSATEKAYAEKLTKKLDDSYQRGTLDRTYAAQMTYELTSLRSKLMSMKNTANSKSVSTFVDGAVANIDAILKAYGAFSATK